MPLLEKFADFIFGSDYKDYLPCPRILSKTEYNFFIALTGVFKDCYVLPKVCLRSIFFAKEKLIFSNYNEKAAIRHKHVDFTIVDNDFKLLYCFELDDSSHKAPDRVERDTLVNGIFTDAGIPLIRIPAQKLYGESLIQSYLTDNVIPAKKAGYRPAVLFSDREKRYFRKLFSSPEPNRLLCYKVTLKEFFRSVDNKTNRKFYKISRGLVTFAVFDIAENTLQKIIVLPREDDEIAYGRFLRKLCENNGIEYILAK